MQNKKKYILILGGDLPLRERILAGALRASKGELAVLLLSQSRHLNTTKFYDGNIVANSFDSIDALAAVKKYEKEFNAVPAAAIPLNEYVVKSAATISEYYKINHNSLKTVDKCRDKYYMKEILAKAGLPVPRIGKFSNFAELEKLALEIGYPLVIKPRALAGSVGVMKVTSHSELKSSFDQCNEEINKSKFDNLGLEYLLVVEEYIHADYEVSIEILNQGNSHRVIAVTDKYLGPEPYFAEIGHSVPSIHSQNKNLIEIAEQACQALEIAYGISHFEAKINSTGDIHIMEIGARTGGDTIMDLVERTYGINLYELHTASYLGIPVEVPKKLIPRGLSAVSFLKAREGVIEKVEYPEFLPEVITNMQITAKPKDISQKLSSFRTREGSVEFFWKKRLPQKGFDEHIKMAEEYSKHIFKILDQTDKSDGKLTPGQVLAIQQLASK